MRCGLSSLTSPCLPIISSVYLSHTLPFYVPSHRPIAGPPPHHQPSLHLHPSSPSPQSQARKHSSSNYCPPHGPAIPSIQDKSHRSSRPILADDHVADAAAVRTGRLYMICLLEGSCIKGRVRSAVSSGQWGRRRTRADQHFRVCLDTISAGYKKVLTPGRTTER